MTFSATLSYTDKNGISVQLATTARQESVRAVVRGCLSDLAEIQRTGGDPLLIQLAKHEAGRLSIVEKELTHE